VKENNQNRAKHFQKIDSAIAGVDPRKSTRTGLNSKTIEPHILVILARFKIKSTPIKKKRKGKITIIEMLDWPKARFRCGKDNAYEYNYSRRDVAQLGSALPWGGRGHGFESHRSDHFRK
jgi:hypothetical protein